MAKKGLTYAQLLLQYEVSQENPDEMPRESGVGEPDSTEKETKCDESHSAKPSITSADSADGSGPDR